MIRLAYRRLLSRCTCFSNDIAENGTFHFRTQYFTTAASSEVQYQKSGNHSTWNSSKESISSFPKSLHQLETAVEDYGHSVASLSTQVEVTKMLISSILCDVEVLKPQFGYSGCKLLCNDGQDSKETLTSKPQDGSERPEFHVLGYVDRDASFAKTQRQSNDFSVPSGSSSDKFTQWTLFLDHLRTFPMVAREGQINSSKTIRRMISVFSQEHAWIFSSLSSQHLQVLAEYGCPTDDRRTIASGKRLRNHLHIVERSICESCELRDACGSAFVKPANVQASLSDVLRLIFSTFEVTTCKKKGSIPDRVRSSIGNILDEITKLSSRRQNGDRHVQEECHNKRYQENTLSENKQSCIDTDTPRCAEHDLQASENNPLKLGGQNATISYSSEKQPISTILGHVQRKEELLQEMLLTVQQATAKNSHHIQTTKKVSKDTDTGEDVISHDHSSIFDNIVEFGHTDPVPATNQSSGNRLSLSELVKQNVSAFVPCKGRNGFANKEDRSYKESEDHSEKEECYNDTTVNRFNRARDTFCSRSIRRHTEDHGLQQGRNVFDKMKGNSRSGTKHMHDEDYRMQYGRNSNNMIKMKEIRSSNDKHQSGRKGYTELSFKKNDRKLRRDRESRIEPEPW